MEKSETIVLAGNPNVGKSTVFNALTGLRQHTGNWTGKTVGTAHGECDCGEVKRYFVDTPGTYSLTPHSEEEAVARDYICFGGAEKILLICDATCLERNLYLVLQTLELERTAVVCVNLLDEARKKGITINLRLLENELGVPVAGTSARERHGTDEVCRLLCRNESRMAKRTVYAKPIEEAVEQLVPTLRKFDLQGLSERWVAFRLLDGDSRLYSAIDEFLGFGLTSSETIYDAVARARYHLSEQKIDSEVLHEQIADGLIDRAAKIARAVTLSSGKDALKFDQKIDRVVTGRYTSFLVLFLLLFFIFYITIIGANVPSAFLSAFFVRAQSFLETHTPFLPDFVRGLLVGGGFRVLGWVVSVMLPPMAIFFPCFTLLEDLGLLPRIAYDLDKGFERAHACGKQALTTCMGFGCNCVGVTGARIIDSRREKLIAILTNSMIPCNGRFPAIILLISVFFVGGLPFSSALTCAFFLALVIAFSLGMTLLVSNLLSHTLLKGEPSHYILELPPYRKPQWGKVIVRSVLDRTLFVLGRAAAVAFPAGIVIYALANVKIGGGSILHAITEFFEPLGRLMGLDGSIVSAFLLGLPANEIVLPITEMSYLSTGEVAAVSGSSELFRLLTTNGWTITTAICYIVFSVLHFPCSTTLLTIRRETGSGKWVIVAALLPTACGMILCMLIHAVSQIFM